MSILLLNNKNQLNISYTVCNNILIALTFCDGVSKGAFVLCSKL